MKIVRLLALPALVLTFTGCASISVEPGTSVVTEQAPQKVYVEGFDTTKADFEVDREGAELAQFKSDLQLMMSTGISVDLTKRLIPATAVDGQPRFPRQNAWLIRGQFVRVNQGSRLLRGAVGFGLGGTKLVTYVWVYDLAQGAEEPFLSFTTTGGSNAEPGALPTLATDPLSLVIEAAGGRRKCRSWTDRGHRANRARDHGGAEQLHVPARLDFQGQVGHAEDL